MGFDYSAYLLYPYRPAVLAIAVLRLSLHNVVGVLGGKHGKPFGDDSQFAQEMRPGKPRPGEYGEMIPGDDWDGEFLTWIPRLAFLWERGYN